MNEICKTAFFDNFATLSKDSGTEKFYELAYTFPFEPNTRLREQILTSLLTNKFIHIRIDVHRQIMSTTEINTSCSRLPFSANFSL